MWREKKNDLDQVSQFLKNIEEFKRLKQARWERVDEKIQMDNMPGTPSEDWINPPDEQEVALELEKDPQYVHLKREILQVIPDLKKIAHFLGFNAHHDFDWVNFTSPLIGNDALEDGILEARRLKSACEERNYPLHNLAALLKIGK